MLLADVGYMFLASILCVSGVQGHTKMICALKGSSVDLPCSANRPISSIKWYIIHINDKQHVLSEPDADGNRLVYNMSKDGRPFLKINDPRESDANLYCCLDKDEGIIHCLERAIQLNVTDLQVQVIPTTEGQTVTLMCSTSCALTETTAVYIWYKNRESLYQDGSPWYQELVSSEEAVRYSCAIKGYEDLRAPEVSVDSVTSTCFSVTYAKGRKCKNKMTSGEKSCTITYPREVHVERGSSTPVSLTCATSCSVTEPETTYRWYQNRQQGRRTTKQFSVHSSDASFSCAIVGLEDLRSDEVCTEDNKCWTVNYDRRRICAPEGSSVVISSNYSHPRDRKATFKWYKIKTGGMEEAKEVISHPSKVRFVGPHQILRMDNLEGDDSAKYTFRPNEKQHGEEIKVSEIPGVTLVVTGLRVTFSPSAVVTEDQRLTMTCSTSCPLPENSTYTWYLNSRPLNPQRKKNKHLILDKVSSEHAGNYYCAAQTGTYSFRSREEGLTVQSTKWKQMSVPSAAGVAGVCVVLLVFSVLTVCLCIRKKKSSHQSTRTEAPINTQQLKPDPENEDISAHPAEQEELHYSRIQFSAVVTQQKTQEDPLYSNFQPHQPRDQENVAYAVVNFRPHMASE